MFKKILITLLIIISCLHSFSQCISDSSITQVGLSPPDSTLPCIERGVYYDEVIQFKNFNLVDGVFLGFPGFTFTIISVLLDSITNIPSGLEYQCNNGTCFFTNSENGCIGIFGTTNDAPGDYDLGFYATIVVDLGSGPLTIAADSALLAGAGLGYTITVINAGDYCANTFVNGPLTITATSDTGVCEGDMVMLFASASGGNPPWNYVWSPGANLNDSTNAQAQLFPTNPGTYHVTVTDNSNNTATSSVVVVYTPSPQITVSPDTSICLGESVQLSASGGTNYQWSPSGSLNDTISANPIAAPSDTTTYEVIVSDGNCSSIGNTTIAVDTKVPDADFGFSINGFVVTFTNFSNNAGNYNWEFGDNGNSVLKNPNHIYNQGGIYSVQLISYSECFTDTVVKIVNLSATGMNENETLINIYIYPNPSNGLFNIEIGQFDLTAVEISLLNMQGSVVHKSTKQNQSDIIIDLSQLSQGLYVLHLKSNNMFVVKKLIVK